MITSSIYNPYILLPLLALLISGIIFPLALRLAHRFQIYDKPNKRKLQSKPIPVMGGIVVVMGIIIPLCIAISYYPDIHIVLSLVAILVLWLIGFIDDVKGTPVWIRFILEFLIVWLLIWHPFRIDNGLMINCLYGLWGRESISLFTSLPISILAGVGIINAINLIDGVDGFSSGYGIVTNTLFAILFFLIHEPIYALCASVAAAALIPFYLHNVFGNRSKMFLGDSGSLVIGLIIANNVFLLLNSASNSLILEQRGIGVVALALAILAIPIFDTLRVMFARMIRGGSPFSPDKTHLHHLFIRMGFSHVGTSTIIIFGNLLIIGIWYISFLLGCNIDMQLYIVISLGLLFTCGVYYFMTWAQRKQMPIGQMMKRWGKQTHFEQKGIWMMLERIVDWPIKSKK